MKTILSIRRISTTLAATAAAVGLLLSAAPLAGAGPASHHASGGGHFEASGSGGVSEFMFAFNARQLNGNGAKGQFEYHNITNGTLLHMRIIYAEFLPNATVGLIGEVTKSVGGNAQIGDCRAVKLQDNGEGKNAPLDMTSKLSNKCSGNSLTVNFGWDDSAFALKPLDSGNIQIR
jgi:hypothetical protein